MRVLHREEIFHIDNSASIFVSYTESVIGKGGWGYEDRIVELPELCEDADAFGPK